MKTKIIFTILLAFVAMTGWAKEDVVVWEMPTTEYGNIYGDGYFNLALDVTKVEMKDSETLVYITAKMRSDYPDYKFQFVGDTYLKVADKRYTLVSADNIELNKYVQSEKDGKRDMVFHFPPLPKDTKAFDFIEGDGKGAFQIKGIKPVEERWKQLLPSYWRNDQGDWKIAFLDDCAIYDCKLWDYKKCDVNLKTGEAQMVLCNGDNELKVKVGKDKMGQRTMQIGDQKATYSMITSRFMPDYPTKDTRTDFVDNGYKHDTITVVGWLKDMPEYFKKQRTFTFGYWNFLVGNQEAVNADLDEQGRFTVRIPVINSTEFFCDWGRCFIETMLEPGNTYFLLYDFKEGRRYFMGDDCRLQNELFKYPLDWNSVELYKGRESTGKVTPEVFDRYITSVDSLLKTQFAKIDLLCQAHPTLSSRFNIYRKNNTLSLQAKDLGQARFCATNYQLTDNARKFAYDTFWMKIQKPVTMHREFCLFMRDYLDDAVEAFGGNISYSIRDHYKEYASNDEEMALLARWAKLIDEVTPIIGAEPTFEAKVRKSQELDSLNADLTKEVEKIFQTPRALKLQNGGLLVNIMKRNILVLDSLGADPSIKDIRLTYKALEYIDNGHTSLLPSVIDTLRTMIGNPIYMAMIEKQNDHYLAIENREFDKLVLKSSDDLKGISEGEALLKKLIEPYKGKFVLLDIWGTWCGPCKEALSHSTEEYARLNDFDIEYLYLANNSPQNSWENVIKEYNVSGDNVAHYNLPQEQQAAIERYLNVHAWPTYKLFDRDGNLLDLEVNPRDLENLARLLGKLTR